ncbi:MAG: Flp family type IVb pilin [Pseudomonadota bacterium]
MGKVLAFLKDKSGATAIEYGLIAALIGVAIISGITAVGTGTEAMYQYITTTITSATGS